MSKKMNPFLYLLVIIAILFGSGCVRVHHVHLASIDASAKGEAIEVLIDKVGIDAAKVAKNIETLASAFRGKDKANNSISNMIGAFQSGPRTGAPVYQKNWGEDLLSKLLKKCPSAQLSNVYSQRLTTDYGGSGVTRETVLVKATCIKN